MAHIYKVTVKKTDRQRTAYYSHSKKEKSNLYYEENGIAGAVRGFGKERIVSIEKLVIAESVDVTKEFLDEGH